MKPKSRYFAKFGAVPAILFLVQAAALAQTIVPRNGYVYPAGGRQGATLEVVVGGQFLDGVRGAMVSGEGIEAAVVEHVKPLQPGQANQLREKLKELLEKRAAADQQRGRWNESDDQALAEIRKKLANFMGRPSTPAIAETVRLNVTIAADAALGDRELRLVTPIGLTSPLAFRVGQLPEYSRKPLRAVRQPDTGIVQPRAAAARALPPDPPESITLPAIVNGQIAPGGANRYRFQAGRGQHLVMAASARGLIPYISDAVPGWFQAAMTLYDGKGKEVAHADHYRFQPDPVLSFRVPEDGEYVLEIRDSIYRGREDFVYRITMGELPYITSIFPLGAKAGSPARVELAGWNLPSKSEVVPETGRQTGVHPFSIAANSRRSNVVPFAIDDLAEAMEKEPNHSKERAQQVKLPVIVNGQIGQPGDTDIFRFSGRAGEQLSIEVRARRLGSPLDSILMLSDSSGRQVAVNDDREDKGAGRLTHHADSQILIRLPGNGTYYLQVGDAQRKGGTDYGYRLRISKAQPDFELRVSPASISARGGTNAPITVHAIRRDGFTGEIALSLNDAPEGSLLHGARIPENQDQIRLTLSVPPSTAGMPVKLQLEGRANVQGHEVRRISVPAEKMTQAFFYQHLVPSNDLLLLVTNGPRARMNWRIDASDPLRLPVGGTARFRMVVPVARIADQIRLSLDEAPEGVSIEETSVVRGGVQVVLRADREKAKAGVSGNLIVEAAMVRPGNTGKAPQSARRIPGLILPAIPFEIVANPKQARK
jgi:hypothetical protein